MEIGVSTKKKKHKFDLGNLEEKIVIECKSHTWTLSGNSPSAKMTIWNEAMFYFVIVPNDYKKILFVKKSIHIKKKETLAQYYFRTYSHFIPENVEIWEYDPITSNLKIISKSTL